MRNGMKAKEKSKIEIMWIWIVFGIGILVEVIFSLLGAGNSANNILNIIISIVFFVIVFIVFMKAYKLMRIGKSIEEDLESAVITIEGMHNDYLTRLENAETEEDIAEVKSVCDELRDKTLFFKCDVLIDAFSEYKQELSNVEKEIGQTVKGACQVRADIEDYINIELVESTIEEHYLSQISGMMTGLGILGTFVGLSIGLNSFDLSGTASEVEGKIAPLMNGIKVAFHTSICGMIYSLLFSYLYRKNSAKLEKAVNSFLDAFEQNVVPSTSNGSANTFVKYQERLCSHLEQNLDYQNKLQQQQKELAEQQLEVLSEAFSKKFSEIMEQKLVPNLQILSQSMNDFDGKIGQAQVDAIKLLTQAFLQQMNNSMAAEMEGYQRAMQESANAQMQTLEQYQNSIEQIKYAVNTFGTNIQTLETEMKSTSKEIRQLSTEFERCTKSVSDVQNEIIEQDAKLGDSVTQITECLEQIHQLQSQMQSLTEDMTNTQKQQKQLSTNMRKQLQDIGKTENTIQENNQEQLQTIIDLFSKTQQMLHNSVSEQMVQLFQEFSFSEKQLNEKIVLKLSETIEDLWNADKQMSSSVEERMKDIENSLTQVLEIMKKTNEQEKLEEIQSSRKDFE